MCVAMVMHCIAPQNSVAHRVAKCVMCLVVPVCHVFGCGSVSALCHVSSRGSVSALCRVSLTHRVKKCVMCLVVSVCLFRVVCL